MSIPDSIGKKPQRSNEEWEAYVGRQFREMRLRSNLDQLELAAQANISVGALKNLEGGKGSTLHTMVKVIRTLEREDWLEALAPPVSISPMQQLRAGQKAQPRQRVYRPRGNQDGGASIKVIGVGGGGCNAVAHMAKDRLNGVEFIGINTDALSLSKTNIHHLVSIGPTITRGLGSGNNPAIGQQAAEESRHDLRNMLRGTDLVFIIAGLGGGTGTGATPVVAEVAKELGIITIIICTLPLPFEGNKRMDVALKGLHALLQEHLGSVIVIPSERLLPSSSKISLMDLFKTINSTLGEVVKSISTPLTAPGVINIDPSDLQLVLAEQGFSAFGQGSGKGQDRAKTATEMAIRSPLLGEYGLRDASGMLITISADANLGLDEFSTIGEILASHASSDATLVLTTALEPALGDELHVSILSTGLPERSVFPASKRTIIKAAAKIAPSPAGRSEKKSAG